MNSWARPRAAEHSCASCILHKSTWERVCRGWNSSVLLSPCCVPSGQRGSLLSCHLHKVTGCAISSPTLSGGGGQSLGPQQQHHQILRLHAKLAPGAFCISPLIPSMSPHGTRVFLPCQSQRLVPNIATAATKLPERGNALVEILFPSVQNSPNICHRKTMARG